MLYAQIDSNNVVVCISILHSEESHSNLIPIESFDETLLGKRYNNGRFDEIAIPAITVRPEIIITEITTNNSNSIIDITNREVTCSIGTSITVHAAIKLNSSVVPITKSFKMPIRSTDNREIVSLINVINGVVSKDIVFDSSGIWDISENSINSGLNEESKMNFSGLRIFVCM